MTSRTAAIVVVALVATTAITLRTLPGGSRSVEGNVVVVRDPDAAYHLRRAEVISADAPTLAVRDAYIGHPEGGTVIWPPLWDLVLGAGISVFPAPAGARGASLPVALLPPLLAAAAALMAAGIARRLWPDQPWAWAIAGLIPALLPTDFPYTRLGQLDHHAAELFLLAGFTLAVGRGLSTKRLESLGGSVLPGVVLGAAILTQLAHVILIPLIAVAALVVPGALHRRARFVASTYLVAACCVLPFALEYWRQGAATQHSQFGLFQPLFLATAAGVTGAIAAWTAPKRNGVLAIALATVATALLVTLSPEIKAGIGFIDRSDSTWIARIGESRSLTTGGLGAFLRETAARISALAWLAPWGLVLAWLGARKGHGAAAALVGALVVTLPMAMAQARFLPHLALFVGLSAVLIANDLLPRLVARGVSLRVARALGLGCLLLVMIPTFNQRHEVEAAGLAFDRARPVLDQLRDGTPPTSGYFEADGQPEYGVLADWSWGHFIQFYAQRPAMVDNFGEHAVDLDRTREIFLATDAAQATAALERARIRYVMVGDLAATFSGLVPGPGDVERFVASGEVHGDRASIRYQPELLTTVLYRAAWQNGGGVLNEPMELYVPPLDRWRLIAESPERESLDATRSVAWVKLYEIVPGARLQWTGRRPGEVLGLGAEVATPSGIDSPYLASAQVAEDGTASLTIPYPTQPPPQPGGRGGHFRSATVHTDAGTNQLPPVTLQDVLDGRTIHVGGQS